MATEEAKMPPDFIRRSFTFSLGAKPLQKRSLVPPEAIRRMDIPAGIFTTCQSLIPEDETSDDTRIPKFTAVEIPILGWKTG